MCLWCACLSYGFTREVENVLIRSCSENLAICNPQSYSTKSGCDTFIAALKSETEPQQRALF